MMGNSQQPRKLNNRITLDEPLIEAIEIEAEIEAAPTPPPPPPAEEEPISLIDDDELGGAGEVKAFGGAASHMGAVHKQTFRRKVNKLGTGSTRCRIFHSKMAPTSLEFMEKQINDWLDEDDTIEVKDIGHVIGQMTGKTTEPHMIVMVWY